MALRRVLSERFAFSLILIMGKLLLLYSVIYEICQKSGIVTRNQGNEKQVDDAPNDVLYSVGGYSVKISTNPDEQERRGNGSRSDSGHSVF